MQCIRLNYIYVENWKDSYFFRPFIRTIFIIYANVELNFCFKQT